MIEMTWFFWPVPYLSGSELNGAQQVPSVSMIFILQMPTQHILKLLMIFMVMLTKFYSCQ